MKKNQVNINGTLKKLPTFWDGWTFLFLFCTGFWTLWLFGDIPLRWCWGVLTNLLN